MEGFLNEIGSYYVQIYGPLSQEKLFSCARDYSYFLRILKKYKKENQVKVFAFCLLPGSAHLVLQEFNLASIKLFLDQLQNGYEKYLRFRLGRAMSWPKRRRRIRQIREDARLFEYIRSLEFKPVFADITRNPVGYRWSSCSYRVLGNSDSILDKEAFFSPTLTLPARGRG